MERGHKCNYRRQIREDLLDSAVVEVITKLVANPRFAAMMQEKINMKVDTSEIEQEIAALEKQLKQSYAIKRNTLEEIENLDPDDRHYKRRKADLDDRLYRMYDKIDEQEKMKMCTAATYYAKNHYFGRNLDLDFSYHEEITVVPRNYPFIFRKCEDINHHYAMIGTAFVVEGYPLFYDAVNEKGLGIAGLNFPGNAAYKAEVPDADNVAPFEFIPWILSRCADVDEARTLISRMNPVNISFSPELPLTPLHWMIADKKRTIVVEPLKDGIRVYDDPVGVMTNNPTFDQQMFHLSNYMHLSNKPVTNTFAKGLEITEYSRGMGAMGMPGDLSSASRFVKAAFTRMNSVSGNSEEESVSQFFHILGSVEQQRGCVCLGEGKYEITVYSSCCNMDRGIYYYRTYENSQITAVDMHKEATDGEALIRYPMIKEQQIRYQN